MLRSVATKALLGALAFGFIQSVCLADQTDSEAAAAAAPAPQAVLVKVNPQLHKVEIYKVDSVDPRVSSQTADNATLGAIASSIATPQNKIGEFQVPKDELDRGSSTSAWFGRWCRPGWGWYGWGGCGYGRPYGYGGYGYGYMGYGAGYSGGFNWAQPYSYPGYFNYGYSNYNYGYGFGYNNCNYGWYW